MPHTARQHPRSTLAAVAALALVLVLARPGDADAAVQPRFLLASAPKGAVVYASPHGRPIATLAARTPLGAPSWLWIVDAAGGGRWGRAVLPMRPNGLTGWIDLRGLRTVRTRVWVAASLQRRRLWLMRGGRALASFSLAIGAATTPTPAGRFSVTDRVYTGDPSGPFGWFAFGLSGHQPNLPPQWAGGDQLAIHGTNQPASIGTAASHGCLRVSASALGRLRAWLRLGTPVVVMASRRRAVLSAVRASVPRYRPDQIEHLLHHHHPLHAHPPVATAPPALVPLPSYRVRPVATGLRAGSAMPAPPVAPPAVLPPRPRDPAHRSSHRRHATPSPAPFPWAAPV